MTTINLTMGDNGKITGFGEKCLRAWKRLLKIFADLEPGEIVVIEYWFPRNSKLHRMHFAMLAGLYDIQEQFDDPEKLRPWVQVGAGHCDFYPGPNGRMVAVPKSISFRSIDDAEFQEHHEAVKKFMRSDRCQSFLWPHLSPAQASEMVETLLRDFEK